MLIVDAYVASHSGVTRESVQMMDPKAKIDRPTQEVITYLQQQNAWNKRPETRIAIGVYDGLSIVGPGTVGAGVGASTLVGKMIQNAAIGTFANGIVQITSDGKYDFVENVTAGIVSAATTGKGLATTVITNAATSGVSAFVQGENIPSSVLIGGIGARVGHYVKSPVLSSFFDEGTQSLLKNLTPKSSTNTHNYFLEKGTENEKIK